MKKLIIAAAAALVLTAAAPVSAANGTSYTFDKLNIVTDGSPNDVENARLTKDITVTTSGNMNRKYAAVTDLARNKDAGTFPANDSFKADGYYIYLGAANANDGAVITLNMPEIKAGSRVELTYAKPVVTNNGSTLRNTNDPYAYFKIADRYISINGDNFDEWRTESVVTGEDTKAIDFYCDKWGAVCISKIEISDGKGEKLHSLNIKSTQFANLTVNGIKFFADEKGELTLTSFPENGAVKITAEKDGYKRAETEVVIKNENADVNIEPECETDAVYYESDFGVSDGILKLDGDFAFAEPIKTDAEVTRLFSRLTFTEGGYLNINGDFGAVKLSLKDDGLYAGGNKITAKDNMEFELFFDRKNDLVFIRQNEEDTLLSGVSSDIREISSLSGENVSVEYIGVSFPDTKKLVIEGADKIVSADTENAEKNIQSYTAVPEYKAYGLQAVFTCKSNFASVSSSPSKRVLAGALGVDPHCEGKVVIQASYNGASAEKEIEVITAPKVSEYNGKKTWYLNLGETGRLSFINSDDIIDDNGIKLIYGNDYTIKDCKSSDENVIKIDDNGKYTAVGKGKATVTFNVYTGRDNILECEFAVDNYYKLGMAEAETTYVINDFEDEHITGFKVTSLSGRSQEIKPTQIPAATVKEDGKVLCAYYNNYNLLVRVTTEEVSRGDKILVSNGKKKVYFSSGGSLEEITESDTATEGFAVTTDQEDSIFDDMISSPHEPFHIGILAYEIDPIYTYTDIGDAAEGVTLDGVFPEGRYDITFKKGELKRGDIYVNGFMAGNNVDQCDTDRKLEEGSEYTVKSFNIGGDGKITVSMTDGSTLLDSAAVSKSSLFDDKPLIYIIGDSLVCNYYGDFEQEVGGGRTGWGQVIGNYIDADIVNLANSGQFAKGLYETAFPSVIRNKPDFCFIECGYNDRSYSTRDEMIECVKNMINECRENNIFPILVTPNASQHDYKESVVWSGYLRDAAVDTDCDIIDLSKESYDFLYSLYGDNEDGVVAKNYNLTEVGGDTLHSSHAAAHKWASIVAQRFKELQRGIFPDVNFNTDFEYSFTDTEGNKITAKVE